jgi:hypothetical protein
VKKNTQDKKMKEMKKSGKKLIFSVQEFGIKAFTCTKQEGDTNEGNKSNINMKKIATIVQKEQQQKLGQ